MVRARTLAIGRGRLRQGRGRRCRGGDVRAGTVGRRQPSLPLIHNFEMAITHSKIV